MKISMIIPFYNVDKAVFNKCVESVLNQTYKDYELIIIDDGSKGEYKDFLKRISQNDSRISLIYQANKGASAARNIGIGLAKGEFICFIDADDSVTPYFLEEAFRIQKKENADIVIGGVIPTEFITNKETCIPKYKGHTTYSGKQLRQYSVGGSSLRLGKEGIYFGRGPYARLIRSEIVKETLFNTELSQGEDILWNLQILNKVKTACLVESAWYIYSSNPESLTHKYNPYILRDVSLEMNALMKEINPKDDGEYVAFISKLLDELRKVSTCYLANKNGKPSLEDKKKTLKEIYYAEPWVFIKSRRFLALTEKKYKLKGILYYIKLLMLYYKLF